MLKTEENSEIWSSDCGGGEIYGFEDLDKFSIDIESFLEILEEESDPSQNQSQCSPEELPCKSAFQGEAPPGEVNHGSSQLQNGVQEYEAPQVQAGLAGSSVWGPSEDLKPPDSTAEIGSDCMFEFPGSSGTSFDHVNMESIYNFGSPLRTCSVSLGDWSTSVEHDTCTSGVMDEGAMNAHFYNYDSTNISNQIPNCGTTFDFASGDPNDVAGCTDHVDVHLSDENGYDFGLMGGDYSSKSASHLTMMEGSCLSFGDNSARMGSNAEDLEAPVRGIPTSNMGITFMDAETSLQNAHPLEINVNQVSVGSNQLDSFSNCFSMVTDGENFADSSSRFQPHKFDLPFMEIEEENMACAKGEIDQLFTSESMLTNSRVNIKAEAQPIVPDRSSVICSEANDCENCFNCQDATHSSQIKIKSSCDAEENIAVSASRQLLSGSRSFMSSMKGGRLLASKTSCSHSRNAVEEADEFYNLEVSRRSACDAPQCGPSIDHIPSHLVSDTGSLIRIKQRKFCVKDEKRDTLVPPRIIESHSTKFTGHIVKNTSSVCRSQVDDDPDICILEDISDPRHPLPIVGHGKALITSQRLSSNAIYHTGTGGTRLKTNDERLTFRVALQDLSQPKSEALPPDGVLAIPLMRHQRIALSWMVQKETASLHCSGGILADDQGLGKTISTIALILKERPPSSKMIPMNLKQDDSKSLNIDDDNDTGICQLGGVKQEKDSGHVGVNTVSVKSENAAILTKGRPAAGTLVVCPTSVLRQWAEELHNKVTREANLSVLVYHGTNRTKDPFELAKYDVVVTTYSIVSMEVPKQPLVDKDDDEKVKPDSYGMEPSSKKRKCPQSSDKKSRKHKKGIDGSVLEPVARPLARVGWFRVVLDEAQSIKNHRTQVARACWGLRAKRRWCLSGTPIQNAVDDLYSYFRFLRYDPYAAYKSFCSMIKVPINRNPTNGYKKLQAVLKTIMLRRTKATRIDGEPIINLPPKSVELKKVDFSLEERDFYSKLEADSRAQFKVYAAAGTVQQNYVNILLMLLRLRQACDHPFLVKGYDSTSVWSSSLEKAKKLPRETQSVLLNCLEACMAICGICNDPPEEAVATICGHVFCNQCISEHLTGDDNVCPAPQCKIHLNATSVFSTSTLKSSLFEQPGHDVSASQPDEAPEPVPACLSDSSKIKAALEVLLSLSKPRDCISEVKSVKPSMDIAGCPKNGESFNDIPEKKLDDSSSKTLEKAIVFSQWTRMLDLLEARLKSSSIQYRRLDGTMSVVARDKAVKDFNTLPEVTVMIMSLKAASLGLNMVAACHVLLLDLWWNPTTEDQAIDRAHRIGQTRPVTVLRLTVKDTVEDRILALQQKKREMVASAFGEDETGSRQSRLTVDDLKYLFMV